MSFREGSKFKPHVEGTDLNESIVPCHTLLHLINPYAQPSLGVRLFRLGSAFAVKIVLLTLFCLEIENLKCNKQRNF